MEFVAQNPPEKHAVTKKKSKTEAKKGRTFLFAVFGPHSGHFWDKKSTRKTPDSHSRVRGEKPSEKKPKIDRTLENRKMKRDSLQKNISQKKRQNCPLHYIKNPDKWERFVGVLRGILRTALGLSGNSRSSSWSSSLHSNSKKQGKRNPGKPLPPRVPRKRPQKVQGESQKRAGPRLAPRKTTKKQDARPKRAQQTKAAGHKKEKEQQNRCV